MLPGTAVFGILSLTDRDSQYWSVTTDWPIAQGAYINLLATRTWQRRAVLKVDKES